MTDEELVRILTLLSDASHEARRLSDQLIRIGEAIKDVERPGWDEGIPRT